jgi:hypothetical protein
VGEHNDEATTQHPDRALEAITVVVKGARVDAAGVVKLGPAAEVTPGHTLAIHG